MQKLKVVEIIEEARELHGAARYREEIKLRLTGGVLDLELSDETIDKVIDAALREVQRYICTTKLATIKYDRCINMKKVTLRDEKEKDKEGKPKTRKLKVNAVISIHRTDGYISTDDQGHGTIDPMQVQQWQLLSGVGNLYNFQNYIKQENKIFGKNWN